MTLVTPEIVFAIAALVFFVQAGNRVGLESPLGWQTILIAQSSSTPRSSRSSCGRASSRWASSSRRRPSTSVRAALDVPAGHAAAARAGDPGRWSAGVHLLVRRLHHIVLRHRTESETLPIYIWGQLRFGVTPAINATAAIMLAFTLVVVVLAYLVLRRSGQERESAGLPGV